MNQHRPDRSIRTTSRTSLSSSTLGALLLASTLAACSSMGSSRPSAVAPLQPTAGNAVTGSVSFRQEGDKIRVMARVTGLPPNTEHGFHVHEKGDCSSPDGMSAGGHFNPSMHPHGPQSMPHHGGDMPSLTADASGNASAIFTIEGVTLGTEPNSLIGKAVIVHAQPDDYKTQPTGNSGARVACGVIAAS
jgi:Cu-Zn family superoxide dismutase